MDAQVLPNRIKNWTLTFGLSDQHINQQTRCYLCYLTYNMIEFRPVTTKSVKHGQMLSFHSFEILYQIPWI